MMLEEIFWTFLISISPAGEARVGIPVGVTSGLPVLTAFLVGWSANLFVFPFFYKLIELSNQFLWQNRSYRKGAVYLSKRAKKKTKNSIAKYGLWGLMVFVMIPLPITGSYMGTLAAYIFGMDYKRSMIAISVGVTISSAIIATSMYLGQKALS